MILRQDDIQYEVYYFPVISKADNQIVFKIGVIGTIYGYTYEVNCDLINELNQINYAENSDWIFYTVGDSVYAENSKKVVELNSENGMATEASRSAVLGKHKEASQKERDFVNKRYSEKKKVLENKVIEFQKFKPREWSSEEEKLNSKVGGLLTLRSPQGQYDYGMCWASVAATIINYMQVTSAVVTGFDVCSRLGIGYDDGGSIYDLADGLNYYNIVYGEIYTRAMDGNEIISNIDAGKPIALYAFGSVNYIGHAVTIRGYSGNVTNVYIWDSYLNNGAGGYASFAFSNSGSCFTINGDPYAWTLSLAY